MLDHIILEIQTSHLIMNHDEIIIIIDEMQTSQENIDDLRVKT